MTMLEAWIKRHPEHKQRIVALTEFGKALWGLTLVLFWAFMALLAVVYLRGPALIYMLPTSAYGYGFKYNVDESSVFITPRPHDCEWGSAPLGNKHCHYKAEVSGVRTAISTDGTTPLVSYDEGNTWTVNTDHVKRSVFVSWTKVDD
jgi:hypothetical protein